MNVIRFGSALVGALCLAGTAFGQSNPLRDDQPYAVRLTRLDDDSARSAYAYDDPYTNTTPVSTSPMKSVAAPAPSNAQKDKASTSDNSTSTSGCTTGNCYDQSMKSNCWGNETSCLPSCNNDHWFAYLGGITMGRDTPNKFWTTFDQANPSHQLLYFPGADWGGGVDTRIGYWFGCGNGCDPCSACNSCGPSGRAGVEVVYWGMWGVDATASVSDPTHQLGTVQDDGLVSFGPNAVSDWFDNADKVTLSRNDEFHNIEINFLYMPCCDTCSRFQMTAIAGIRFFRFSEGLTWDQFGGSGVPGGADPEAVLTDNVQNNLIGFQIGSYMSYRVGNRLSLFAIPKVGVFGNHIVGFNSLTNDGTTATFDNSGDELRNNNTKNVTSLMGSIDVGANWDCNQTWSVVAGFRAVLATDMALGDNQIPQFFADEQGWKTINSNGDLILYGAFAGLQARF